MLVRETSSLVYGALSCCQCGYLLNRVSDVINVRI